MSTDPGKLAELAADLVAVGTDDDRWPRELAALIDLDPDAAAGLGCWLVRLASLLLARTASDDERRRYAEALGGLLVLRATGVRPTAIPIEHAPITTTDADLPREWN